jgi:ferrochelatase
LLAQKLDKKLPDVDVQYAMRYQSPSIKMTLNTMLLKNPDEIVILPLFPHYAAATTGSVFKEVTSYLSDKWVVPKVTFINQFYDNAKFIEAWLEKAREFDMNSYNKIIFSYHGVPNSHVDNVYPDSMCSDNDCENKITNDNKFCYKATVYETTKILATKLGLDPNQYIVTFQSRLTNKWLSPFTDDVLQNLPKNGSKKVLVFSPAFTADCLETIIEIGDEYKELFYEAGGETLDYVPSLNYSDKWVDAIVDISNINEDNDV